MYGPFHRIGDSADVVRRILDSGELWGQAPRNFIQSDIRKVKAFSGPLPAGVAGIEFETDVPPDPGCVPWKPTWAAGRRRVVDDGVYAKIKVPVLKQTVIL